MFFLLFSFRCFSSCSSFLLSSKHFVPRYVSRNTGLVRFLQFRRNCKWEVFTHGGRNETGIDAIEWARRMAADAGELLLTSMDRDGTKSGFDVALTRAVSDAVTVPVIASGGVGTLQHLVDGVVEGDASAVLAASIFHFGEFTIAEAKAHMTSQGVAVRP